MVEFRRCFSEDLCDCMHSGQSANQARSTVLAWLVTLIRAHTATPIYARSALQQVDGPDSRQKKGRPKAAFHLRGAVLRKPQPED